MAYKTVATSPKKDSHNNWSSWLFTLLKLVLYAMLIQSGTKPNHRSEQGNEAALVKSEFGISNASTELAALAALTGHPVIGAGVLAINHLPRAEAKKTVKTAPASAMKKSSKKDTPNPAIPVTPKHHPPLPTSYPGFKVVPLETKRQMLHADAVEKTIVLTTMPNPKQAVNAPIIAFVESHLELKTLPPSYELSRADIKFLALHFSTTARAGKKLAFFAEGLRQGESAALENPTSRGPDSITVHGIEPESFGTEAAYYSQDLELSPEDARQYVLKALEQTTSGRNSNWLKVLQTYPSHQKILICGAAHLSASFIGGENPLFTQPVTVIAPLQTAEVLTLSPEDSAEIFFAVEFSNFTKLSKIPSKTKLIEMKTVLEKCIKKLSHLEKTNNQFTKLYESLSYVQIALAEYQGAFQSLEKIQKRNHSLSLSCWQNAVEFINKTLLIESESGKQLGTKEILQRCKALDRAYSSTMPGNKILIKVHPRSSELYVFIQIYFKTALDFISLSSSEEAKAAIRTLHSLIKRSPALKDSPLHANLVAKTEL